jgi:hypothetical protein
MSIKNNIAISNSFSYTKSWSKVSSRDNYVDQGNIETSGMSDGDLKTWLTNNAVGEIPSEVCNKKISLSFKLDIRLFGRKSLEGGKKELFKFILDDVAIECEYEYDAIPILKVTGFSRKKCNPGDGKSGTVNIENLGYGSTLNWELKSVERTGTISLTKLYLNGIAACTYQSGEIFGSNLDYGDTHSVQVEYTIPLGASKNQVYKWELNFQCIDTLEEKSVTVSFGTVTGAKPVILPIHNYIASRFPQIFTLIQRLPAFQ